MTLNIIVSIIGITLSVIFVPRALNDLGFKFVPKISTFFGEFSKEGDVSTKDVSLIENNTPITNSIQTINQKGDNYQINTIGKFIEIDQVYEPEYMNEVHHKTTIHLALKNGNIAPSRLCVSVKDLADIESGPFINGGGLYDNDGCLLNPGTQDKYITIYTKTKPKRPVELEILH